MVRDTPLLTPIRDVLSCSKQDSKHFLSRIVAEAGLCESVMGLRCALQVTRTAPKQVIATPELSNRERPGFPGRAVVCRVNSSQGERLYTEVVTTAGQGVEGTTPEFDQQVDFHKSGAARLPERIDLPAISNSRTRWNRTCFVLFLGA